MRPSGSGHPGGFMIAIFEAVDAGGTSIGLEIKSHAHRIWVGMRGQASNLYF